MRHLSRAVILLAVLLLLTAGVANAQTFFPSGPVNIMAPAAEGGGWDSTARALQTALLTTTGQPITVYNVPGAGGTVGLAEFVKDHTGQAHELMVMGLVMVGAIETNQSAVNLSQVTPIASLTSEWEVIVVPADSKYRSMNQLVVDFQDDPAAVSWAGGSAGGTDHILVGLIAQAVGVPAFTINYMPFSGGGEAKATILSGAASAGIGGLSEYRAEIDSGALRVLGVSSAKRLDGVDAPTLQESGIGVVLANWRALVAPGGITPEERAAIITAIEIMHEDPSWQDALKSHEWNDFFRTGDNFAAFLNTEQNRVRHVLSEIGLISPLMTTGYPSGPVNLLAPAGVGGGWDSTARVMQTALQAATSQPVQVYNVPGAGGTVGLAQFVAEHNGQSHELMVMGLVMVGAIETNKSAVNLSQITPIASLTSEWEAIVVPADSPYRNFRDLIAAFKTNPQAVAWGGGSAGGTDHILVALIAQSAAVDAAGINYVAHSGGGEAKDALLAGDVNVGVGNVSEYIEQVKSGALRLLAVSSPERLDGVDAPTIKEMGTNVVLANWRAVVAPAGISTEERDAIVKAIEAMHASPEWQAAIAERGWNDFFQTGDTFASFLDSEVTRIQGVLKTIGLA